MTDITPDKEYNKLSIDFYGGSTIFSKKETPLKARVIYCCAEHCDLRDAGICVCMRKSLHWLDPSYDCPFGKVEVHKGYTSRAKKYYSFREKYEQDPAYKAKFSKIGKYYFGHADGHYIVQFDWAGLNKDDDGWHVSPYSRPAFIPEDEFDVEMIFDMLTHSKDRQARLKERNTTHIPLFLRAMAKGNPEKFGLLVMLHPELADYKLDVIGKDAYLRTLVDGSVVELDGQKWTKMGNKVVCDDYKAASTCHPFAHGPVELEILPEYTVKVKDEAWCDENTEFKS